MSQQLDAEVLPTIIVSKAEYETLTGLAAAVEEKSPDIASILQAEMDRAEIVPAEAVPPNVVRMGSRVEFRSDSGQQRTVTLVFPGEADIAEGKISILTPIGTALIGLAAGQSITWAARDGRRQRLTVLKVEQPASADA